MEAGNSSRRSPLPTDQRVGESYADVGCWFDLIVADGDAVAGLESDREAGRLGLVGDGGCVIDGCCERVDHDAVELGTVAGDPGCVGGVGVGPLFSGQIDVECVMEPEGVGDWNGNRNGVHNP